VARAGIGLVRPAGRQASPSDSRRQGLRQQIVRQVDFSSRLLLTVSHRLHANPELAFGEWQSAALISGILAERGLTVSSAVAGLPTAFSASAGDSRCPEVVLCCEYDALPGLGHACGHNVIAAAALGAGIALAPLAAGLGARLTVLGTPAEEGGGGKILLARAGLFDRAVVAMMVHPSAYETAVPPINALVGLDFTMLGKAAHASMAPEQGVNALDGIVLGYLGVAALRQQLAPGDRVHGVITDGGGAPNIVPAQAKARVLVRSRDTSSLQDLRRRVVACFQAGADAAGAKLRVSQAAPTYAEMRPNNRLASCYERNARLLGRRPLPAGRVQPNLAGSTDMGNVSQIVPSLHAMMAISSPDVMPHSVGFVAAARSPAADRAVLDGAKALALTTLDVWLNPGLRAAIRRDHLRRREVN
jgi:amidohydrolase